MQSATEARGDASGPARAQGPELTVVVPTYDERDNVEALVEHLDRALCGICWEVIFVDDDSKDGTSRTVRQLARRDARVRGIQRIGRRGLATACIEGMLASSAPYVAVMDADLQHDETRLLPMLATLREDRADLVVGTRYATGGSVGDWNAGRARMSRFATWLSGLVVRQTVTDPMSGFFMLRRELLEDVVHRLSGMGFKILLDIVVSSERPPRIAEVPYTFRPRASGQSKLDGMVLWEFGMLLADKTVGRWVPVRFLSFALVGALGVVVHFAVLTATLKGMGLGFGTSQATATIVAMAFNFAINNVLTYRDQRLRGTRWLRGLLSFMAACSVGALANIGVATYLFESRTQWALAAAAGIVVGVVWNYVVSSVYTWGSPRRSA